MSWVLRWQCSPVRITAIGCCLWAAVGLNSRSLRSAAAVDQDGQLQKQVESQIEAGHYQAAVASVAGLSDDRLRNELLTRVVAADPGARGGGSQADFGQLIDLITTTIEPESWQDLGGNGAIDGFEGGVHVDSSGLLFRIMVTPEARDRLSTKKLAAAVDSGNREVRQTATMRKVSLNRLERMLMIRRALGQPPDAAMRHLAGIYHVKYLLVYPESKDIVLAGPAGAWHEDAEGRTINVATGDPVLHLDDLVTLLRNAYSAGGKFGCSIMPRRENLARTQIFLTASSKSPLKPGAAARDQWVNQLRDQVGRQTIEIHGVDPRTRTARVLIEADYRMKLIGMGLEESVPDVPSYLDLIDFDGQGQLPPMDVLRWWFTLNQKSIHTTESHDVFRFSGQSVQLLSENELLTRRGDRVHTGKAEKWNRQFARSFTKHFDQLAAKYPIYAELRNVFDLALVAALIREEDLASQVDWSLTYFGDHATGRGLKYAVTGVFAPQEVESVINYRLLDRRHFVAGVSGGIHVETAPLVNRDAIAVTDDYTVTNTRADATPHAKSRDTWWWD